MSESAEYQAMVYDNRSDAKLLLKKATSSVVDNSAFFRFKTSSCLVLGMMVGFFIQFSALSVIYLGESILLLTQRDRILLSLSWSLLISYMAILLLLLLAFLRSLIRSAYQGKDVKDIALHVESRYVFEALIVVCTAWAATDVALGMTGQVVYPVIFLVLVVYPVVVLVVALPSWFFTLPLKNRVLVDDTETKDEVMVV